MCRAHDIRTNLHAYRTRRGAAIRFYLLHCNDVEAVRKGGRMTPKTTPERPTYFRKDRENGTLEHWRYHRPIWCECKKNIYIYHVCRVFQTAKAYFHPHNPSARNLLPRVNSNSVIRSKYFFKASGEFFSTRHSSPCIVYFVSRKSIVNTSKYE